MKDVESAVLDDGEDPQEVYEAHREEKQESLYAASMGTVKKLFVHATAATRPPGFKNGNVPQTAK